MENETREYINPEVITSLVNPLIKRVRALAVRPADGMCVVAGRYLFDEAMKAKVVDTAFFIQGADTSALPSSLKVVFVNTPVMEKLAGVFAGQKVVALCKIRPARLKDFSRIILLDGVQDPGNVGTIVRTAHALGYDGVALLPGCADVSNAKTIAASKGAVFHMPVERFSSLSDFRQKISLPIVGTANAADATEIEKFSPPAKFALAFGQEGKGMEEALLKACASVVKVRQVRFDSLNVAAAFAIVAYAFAFAKGKAGI